EKVGNRLDVVIDMRTQADHWALITRRDATRLNSSFKNLATIKIIIFKGSVDRLKLHSFPTRRSSDLTKNQAVATSQEAVQNQNEPQLRDENAHNDKSVHGVLNPTYQAGLRRDAVQPDIEAERKKRDEIEAGKSYCSRRFGGATCDDKSAQIYARFDKNDWRIQPAEFYRFHDAEVNTFGYF